jgi:hypothetical protein
MRRANMTAWPLPNLATKSDDEIDSWIEKYVARGLTSDPTCLLLLEERGQRQSKVLKIEKSLDHLMDAARRKKFTTYGALAMASDVPWKKARHLMNGARGHLDRLLEICHARQLPLLTALCVNQESVKTGDLSEESLNGFINGAQRLGYPITDRKAFLRQCQNESFGWAERQSDETNERTSAANTE